MPQTFLSDLAVVAPRMQARGLPPAPATQVEASMRENGWTMLRAWREQLGYSRAAMAGLLKLAAPTYAMLEDGTVPLCCWTAPGLEMLLLAATQQYCRSGPGSGMNAPLAPHYMAAGSTFDGYPL